LGLVGTYLVALVAFLAIDAIALKYLMFPLFSRHVSELLREEMHMGVAIGFYVFFVGGILHFAVLPGLGEQSLGRAVFNGALLGFLAYGTYEATNMATLRGWSWQMVAADVTWGAVLSGTVAAVGWFAGRQFL
jgi:uncharacterized membrane protein